MKEIYKMRKAMMKTDCMTCRRSCLHRLRRGCQNGGFPFHERAGGDLYHCRRYSASGWEYTVFGEVVEGMDIVDKIQNVKTDRSDRPEEDVKIVKVSLLIKMIKISRHVLANGLRLVHSQDESTQMVALNIVYNVGPGTNIRSYGFAHLFEHLMFGGSVNIPDYDAPLQLAGGENNAGQITILRIII